MSAAAESTGGQSEDSTAHAPLRESGIPRSEPLSRTALGVYSGFALTMLGIGFRLGWSHQIRKNAQSEGMLLGERSQQVAPAAARRIRKPSAEPAILARRALGIATLICISSASLVSLGVAWYMDISSFQQFSDRLKVIVPHRSRELQGTLNPALTFVKGGLQRSFESLQPILVRGRNDRTPEEIRSEKQELKDAGLDVYLLDPSERE